jgi:hypothetical protein
MTEGKNRIMIFGTKADGTYIVEFRTAKGEVLAISIPSGREISKDARWGEALVGLIIVSIPNTVSFLAIPRRPRG